MKRYDRRAFRIAAILALLALPARAQIVREETCVRTPVASWEAYVEAETKRDAEESAAAVREGFRYAPAPHLTKDEYARRVAEGGTIECRRIVYRSDGLDVVAFLWKPKTTEGKKLPLIIFNRGGNSEFSRLTPSSGVRRLALEGFVVLGSQYRGADGGQGKDEFGGGDVNDVLNLDSVARSLDFIDTRNVFLYGHSRGGMMTALALKKGMKVNAAAVGGPLVDLLTEGARRPGLPERVWSRLIPGFAERRDEVLRERSAMYWPDRINVPLLILQGGADWRVDPAQTLAFAQALQRSGKTYELIVYAGDDHGIAANRDDANRRIVEWFRRHMK